MGRVGVKSWCREELGLCKFVFEVVILVPKFLGLRLKLVLWTVGVVDRVGWTAVVEFVFDLRVEVVFLGCWSWLMLGF